MRQVMANHLTLAALETFGYDQEQLSKLLDLNVAEEQYRAYKERLARASNQSALSNLEPIFSHIQRGGFINE